MYTNDEVKAAFVWTSRTTGFEDRRRTYPGDAQKKRELGRTEDDDDAKAQFIKDLLARRKKK